MTEQQTNLAKKLLERCFIRKTGFYVDLAFYDRLAENAELRRESERSCLLNEDEQREIVHLEDHGDTFYRRKELDAYRSKN